MRSGASRKAESTVEWSHTPVFRFSGVTETFVDSPTIASRWQIQFGLRYLFN